MLIKGLIRFFPSILRADRKSFFLINSSGYQSRFYFRNIRVSASVRETEKNDGLDNLNTITFREYIEKNNNFKSPISEIMNLNFSPDKHESMKLLLKLKENVENDCLWQEMLDSLKREISTFDLEDFLKIITLASGIEVKKGSENISDFLKCLDNELRVRTLKLNDILEILYVLKHTLLNGKSLKHFGFYLKMCRSFHKLSKFQPLQVIHIFYYVEEMNENVKAEYKYPLLKYAKENISQLKIDEMGIVLAALIRAKIFTLDGTFIQKITEKLLDEIEAANSFHLFYASKFLSNCASISNGNIILDFQGKLIPHISKFNPRSLISTLLSGCPFSLNMSLWNNVLEKLKTELKTLAIVDIERMTRITTAFKIENKDEFLNLAVEAIEERENLGDCAVHFVNFCKHLVIHRIYPKKLLDIVLSKDFIEIMKTRSFSKEMGSWAFLNYSLQIDKPECQCKYLDEDLKKYIMKGIYSSRAITNFISPFRTRKRLGNHLKAIFGDNAVNEVYCLPHVEKGLVMRFDEDLNATVLPQDFFFGSKELVHAPSDQHLWIWLNATFISSEGLSPLQETYMRHLSAFGYKPIVVEMLEFYHHGRLGAEQLQKYLKGLFIDERFTRQSNLKLNTFIAGFLHRVPGLKKKPTFAHRQGEKTNNEL